jgi:cobalt/nickel transport system permease protein
MLGLLFGVWMGFVAISLVLVLQALLLGAGGVTALPVNALAMGLAGCATAVGVYRLLRRWWETAAVGAAGWAGVTLSSLVVALVLGIQPWIASDAAGEPLFFPFGPAVTLPAVAGPAALVGIGEGALTVAVWRYARSRAWIDAH